DGLWLQLDAYRCHVFWQFRAIADPAGIWRRLAGELGGGGVPSLDDALRELELEPVHAAVRAVAADAGLVALVRDGTLRDAQSIEAPIASFATIVRDATGTTGEPAAVAAVTARRLASIASSAARGAAPGATAAVPDDGVHRVAAAFGDPWHRSVLAGWSVLEPLGRLAPDAMTGPTSRAWFDELRLAGVVATSLRDAGLDEAGAWSASERIRILLALPRPSNIGGTSTGDRVARLASAWLDHPDVRTFLHVNAWEGVEWLGREAWRELLDWALLLDAIDGVADMPASAAVVTALVDAGEESGYQVDALRTVVRAGAPPTPRPAEPPTPAGAPANPAPRR
ncbi:MAG: hypothetical protein ACJ77B_04920, partial [Chloroflexota bacterium]